MAQPLSVEQKIALANEMIDYLRTVKEKLYDDQTAVDMANSGIDDWTDWRDGLV